MSVGSLMSVLTIVGIFANVSVVYLFMKRKCIQSRTSFLIRSLAVSDGIMAALGGTMFSINCFNHTWIFQSFGKPPSDKLFNSWLVVNIISTQYIQLSQFSTWASLVKQSLSGMNFLQLSSADSHIIWAPLSRESESPNINPYCQKYAVFRSQGIRSGSQLSHQNQMSSLAYRDTPSTFCHIVAWTIDINVYDLYTQIDSALEIFIYVTNGGLLSKLASE